MSWFFVLFCLALRFAIYYVCLYLYVDGLDFAPHSEWNRASAFLSFIALFEAFFELMDFMIAREKKNYALCMSMRMVSSCHCSCCRVLCVANSISRCLFFFINLLCCATMCVCVYVFAQAHSLVCRYLHSYICAN